MSHNVPSSPSDRLGRVDWGRAVTAGVVATIVMTAVMALMGTNIVKMLGGMIVGAGSVATQYIVGGLIHFMIGIGFGLLYAALFGPVVEWNRVLKGAVYGLVITAVALAAMPVMSAMMGGGGAGAQNPCGPPGQPAAANPCATATAEPQNPCAPANPCAPNPCAPANPCAPNATATQASNPCAPAAGNPCNPCGGSGGSPWSGVLSMINHLVYSLTLAFVYGKAR